MTGFVMTGPWLSFLSATLESIRSVGIPEVSFFFLCVLEAEEGGRVVLACNLVLPHPLDRYHASSTERGVNLLLGELLVRRVEEVLVCHGVGW